MERFGITNIHDFLNEKLHILSNQTKVDPFIGYMRSQTLLSQDEKEQILALTSTRDRNVELINLVKYKGVKGFIAYMYVLEWVYPELFTKVTDLPAEKPPRDFGPTVRDSEGSRTSVMLLRELHKCMGTFMEDNIGQNLNIGKLKETVSKLEKENEIMITDIANLERKLRKNEDDIDDQKTTKDKMLEKMDTIKKDKTHLKEKINEKICDLNRLKREINPPVDRKISLPKFFEQTSTNEELLNGTGTGLNEDLNKITENLSEKQKENAIMSETIEQLLKLNKRIKEDFKLACTESFLQRITINQLTQKDKCHIACCSLERKGAVKKKKEQIL